MGDALTVPFDLWEFDLIWASPPCQAYSAGTAASRRGNHPRLIGLTRRLLAGHPLTVIENVMRSPLRPDLVLDGPMFGLDRIERRRKFELSWPVLSPPSLSDSPRPPAGAHLQAHVLPDGDDAAVASPGPRPEVAAAVVRGQGCDGNPGGQPDDQRGGGGVHTPVPCRVHRQSGHGSTDKKQTGPGCSRGLIGYKETR